jgi:hypothetical protein
MRESKITKVEEECITPPTTIDAIPESSEEMMDRLNIDDGKHAPVATVSNSDRVESLTDSSLSDEANSGEHEKKNPSVGAAAAAVTAAKPPNNLSRTISHESSSSSNTKSDYSGDARISVGNWGWFEDVHGHESVFLPGMMPMPEGEEGGDGGKAGKKKGGLLQMGSELMSSTLYSVIEPHRGELKICSLLSSLLH